MTSSLATAQDQTLKWRLQQLEASLKTLQDEIGARDARIDQLESQLKSMRGGTPVDSAADAEGQRLLDQLAAPTAPEKVSSTDGDIWRMRLNETATVRLMDISAVINSSAGTSSEYGHHLEELQGGAHDPRRGFTFQQLELSLSGAIDPYFRAEAHIIFSDHGAELEEAFATTSSMPFGLQVKAGYYLTDFGRINPSHPHSWDWIDQPVVATRMFGGEGMRGAGAQLNWLTPLPWYSELGFGMQNANGEYMVSFLGGGQAHGHDDEGDDEHQEGIGGWPVEDRDIRTLEDLVYSARWVNAVDVTRDLSAQFGLSGLYGGNNTGNGGYTTISGTDFVLKYHPAGDTRQRPLLTWQTELMQRDYHGDDVETDHGPLEADTLHDWGMYTQLLYNVNRDWSAGLRYEYASGSGENTEEDERVPRSEDPFRADRHRVSPLLVWHPTEFTRLRLQYNYDHADHLHDKDAHSLWLGLEVLLGSHPAHRY